MQWALVKKDNSVSNLIEYDPPDQADNLEERKRKTYNPPDDLTLRQVEDWVGEGMDADTPEPQPEPEEGT